MLDALKYDGWFTETEPTLRYDFNTASAAETAKLGAAFASVVKYHAATATPEKRILRIGFVALRESGKSTFANGLLGAFPERRKMETPPAKYCGPGMAEYAHRQGLWHSADGGWMRHYDAGFKNGDYGVVPEDRDLFLPSYWKDDTAHCTPALTDIVEHAADDKNDTRFDYLILMGKGDRLRHISIRTGADRAQCPGLRKFLQEAQPHPAPRT